jgi:hypothetical protein
MKLVEYITTGIAALILTLTGTAQSRAYAKFDGNGEIIGLFNLLSGQRCLETQTLAGNIQNVRSEIRSEDIVFSFGLVSVGRRRVVEFSLKNDSIPRADIEKLLTSNGKRRIVVAACQSGSRWTAHQITRQ